MPLAGGRPIVCPVLGGPFDELRRLAASREQALLAHRWAVGLIELDRTVPRRVKKALRKLFSGAPLGPRETVRLCRAFVVTGLREPR